MNSIQPTPDEMERQMKLMRKISVAPPPDPNAPPLTPKQREKQEKKIKKILKRHFNDIVDNYTPIEN